MRYPRSARLLGVGLLLGCMALGTRAEEPPLPVVEPRGQPIVGEQGSVPESAGCERCTDPAVGSILDQKEPPKNPYAGDLRTRSRALGDLGGVRSKLAEKGITFDLFATQYYSRIVQAGIDQDSGFGGKLDYLLNVDGGKLGLAKGLFLNLHGETRYGESLNDVDGLISPSNLVLSLPKDNQNITALTGVKITQAFSENFVVFGGKINTLDDLPLRYSAELGLGGAGRGGFQNTSLVFNPIAARTVPYSTAGGGFAILSEGQPLFTMTFLDPMERATIGLEDLFDRGVVYVPDLTFRTQFFGLPGIYDVSGTYSTASYTSVDPSAYLNVLGQRLRGRAQGLTPARLGAPREDNSWSVSGSFYQALFVRPDIENASMGAFGSVGLSDGNPNPVQFTASFGVGGRSLFRNRPIDVFGIGYFYTGLSDDFKRLTARFAPQRDERGLEAFYNYAITPWARLSTDIQVILPSDKTVDTTVIGGLRFQVLF